MQKYFVKDLLNLKCRHIHQGIHISTARSCKSYKENTQLTKQEHWIFNRGYMWQRRQTSVGTMTNYFVRQPTFLLCRCLYRWFRVVRLEDIVYIITIGLVRRMTFGFYWIYTTCRNKTCFNTCSGQHCKSIFNFSGTY